MIEPLYCSHQPAWSNINEYHFRKIRWVNNSVREVCRFTMLEF